ncbi:MAG: CPBP family intramembrane metalloprotease [Phycisphaerae bacterium]|jgi:membrane protease YdiL (CAAX protease family)
MTGVLDKIDYGLMMHGAVVVAGGAYVWNGGGRKDPLRGSPIRANRLTILHVWVCVAACFLGWSAGGKIGTALAPADLSGDRLLNWQSCAAAAIANGVIILACLLVAGSAFARGLRGLGWGRRSLRSDLAWATAGFLVAVLVVRLLLFALEWVIETFFRGVRLPEHSVFQVLNDADSGPGIRVVTLAGAFVLAPAGEELLFRGILQTALRRAVPPRPGSLRHRWWAILVTGLLFGAVHGNTPHYIPALAFLGVLLGFLYERTGSIRACILVHMLFNGRSLLWDYLAAR